MARVQREVLSYDQIAERAEQVLREKHPLGTIPVPVEEIAEFGFDLEIQVKACLRELADVEALISHDCTTMYVDAHAFLAHSYQRRLRFSFAHEIGHCVLHRNVLAALPFSTFAEWKTRYHSMQGEDLKWIEFQANAFAGLLLVPRGHLARAWTLTIQQAPKVVRDDPEYLQAWAIEEMSKQFNVSDGVITRRCQYDGLIKNPKQTG